MSVKKSILAETLETIQTAQQQVEENANFILSTTLKEELSEIISKGLTESKTDDITVDDTTVDTPPTDDVPATDDVASLETPAGEESVDGEEEVVDLTGATPEEVISSFQLMAPADEIEIVRSENGIEINFNPENSEETPVDTVATPDVSPELNENDEETKESLVDENQEEETVFEIEITEDDETVTEETPAEDGETPVDEAMSHHVGMKQRNIAHNENDPNRVEECEDDMAEATVTETEEEKVEDVKESHNALVAARKKNTTLVLENKRLQKQLTSAADNVTTFKEAEAQYKAAIEKLKNQLQEVALYTSNLTYAVKLMTENTTTKDEKINILQRLDSAKTITESREVYKTINESFKGSKNTKAEQIIEAKIINDTKTSGSSKLNETTVYVKNPGVERIKEIINKIK